jgi:hypothetical protein
MTRTATLAAAALLALTACKGSTGRHPVPLPAYTEDSFDTNSLPSYERHSDGGDDWKILNGTLVGSGPAIQSVLVRNGVSMTDGWVEAVSSRADDGGLVLRFEDGANYYLLTFRDDAAPAPRGDENLAVYHHIGDEYDQMWVKDVRWTRGSPHTIRFEAEGGLLRVYFDGVQQVELMPDPEINDPAPYTGAGGLGVRHYGDDSGWITVFDAVRWHVLR